MAAAGKNTKKGSAPSASAKKNTRKRKRAMRRRIIRLVFLLLVLLGLLAVFAGLKLFEKKTGESFFDCIREGQEIAENSTSSDFSKKGKTYIYDSEGDVIGELAEDEESTYLTYDNIPSYCVEAFVSVEDRTFWKNNGTDPKGMVRVLWNYIKSRGKTANGASTITQQLVKLTYLSTEKTLSRKVKEIVIAIGITKKYSKEKIMEYYCNTCCFANGIYGIEDASLAYFGTSVKNLDLSQIAYLCAIPNYPEYYNPKTNPDHAITRRNKILKDMLEMGYISQEQYDQAVAEDIAIYTPSEEEDSTHNFETTYAINCAVKYIMKLQDFDFRYTFASDEDYETYSESYTEAYAAAKHELTTGGYKVYTTIDSEIQEKMQEVLDEQLSDQTEKLDTGIYKLQGAMTVIDNSTGKVISVIGGRSQEETEGMYTLNRAYQGYAQPGSSIKPLVVYTPALETGEYTPSSLLYNIDVDEAKTMKVSEISQMTGQQVTFRSAVENSLNGCAYWLFANIGVQNGLSYVNDMNFSKIIPGDFNMSACLGGLTYGVTTEEMANAYYTLENDGEFTDTDCLYSIIDSNGKEIYEEPDSLRVYTEDACRAMTDVMKGVLTEGTAKKSDWYSYTSTEAAGKTGTTNDNKAAWFCGYTPYYTISVWVGCDTPVSVQGLVGGSYPLSIWKNAMLFLIDGKPAAYFPENPIEEETETEEECTCTIRCTQTGIDQNCPVCSEDYSKCTCQTEGICTCTEKCDSDAIDETCPVCVRNFEDCIAPEAICTCLNRCTEDSIDQTCRVCGKDIALCQGIQTLPEKETESQQADENSQDDHQPDQGKTEEPVSEEKEQEGTGEEQAREEQTGEEENKTEENTGGEAPSQSGEGEEQGQPDAQSDSGDRNANSLQE